MKRNKLALLRPLLLLFILANGFFVLGRSQFNKWNAGQDVLIIGNLLLLVITLLSFLFIYRGLQSANPHSFIRAMYGSFIIKFFVIAIAAFVYIMITKKNVSKTGIIICMFLYLLYTFIEVSVLTKLLKQKKNA